MDWGRRQAVLTCSPKSQDSSSRGGFQFKLQPEIENTSGGFSVHMPPGNLQRMIKKLSILANSLSFSLSTLDNSKDPTVAALTCRTQLGEDQDLYLLIPHDDMLWNINSKTLY